MIKILFFLLTSLLLFANNITTTQKKISQTKFIISKMNQKLDIIADKIQQKELFINKINKKIGNLNIQINFLNKELNNSKTKLSDFNRLKNKFIKKSTKIQNEIINFISENYFNSTSKTENIRDLIDKEITKKILERYSHKINSLIQKNKKILNQITLLNKKINNIKQKQILFIKAKQKLALLKQNRQKELLFLKQDKITYKKRLKNLIKKEENLQNKLAQLNIIKIKKRKYIKQQNQNLKVNLNLNVKKYGSLYFTPSVTNYRGLKTIAPIKGKIIKKFGSYIDPVYHIRIYNDSITIKSYKKNAIVRAILSGRIIYVGTTNGKGIIIIRHRDNLFSIYANLERISPILRKGLYVKKGQIIARIKNNLEFEITYKNHPINPIRVIAFN